MEYFTRYKSANQPVLNTLKEKGGGVPLRERVLDALDGQGHQVGDAGDLALDEGLGIAHAGQQAVVAGGGEGALADVFFGDEKACSGGLRSVLRAVGQQGL